MDEIRFNNSHIAKVYEVGELEIIVDPEMLKRTGNKIYIYKSELLQMIELLDKYKEDNNEYKM